MMKIEHKPLAEKAYVVVLWGLPLAYLLLLQRIPQIYADAGLIVGLLLALYGLGSGLLLRRIGWRQMMTPFDWGFLMMAAALVVSAVFSIDPSRSWRTVWNWIGCLLAVYMAVIFLRAGSPIQKMVQGFLAVISLMLVAAYVEFFGWLNRWLAAFGLDLLPGVAQVPRIGGINGSPNILGFYVAIGVLLALTYRTVGEQKWPWLARLWVVVALPVLFLARSRSAFLGLAAGLSIVILGWFWIRMRGALSYKTAVRALGAIAFLGVVAVGAVFLLRPDTSLSERNVSYRLQLWEFAVETWQTYPVTGSGADTFGTAVLLLDDNVPPQFPLRAAHNWWFSILSETGLLGIGSALLCWGLLLRFLWRYQRYDHWSLTSVGILASLVVFAGHGLLDTPEHWVILTAALLFGGVIVALEPVPVGGNRYFVPLVWGGLWVILLVGGYQGYTAASIYEDGLAMAADGDWQAAVVRFDEAQQQLPYTDSAFALSTAYAHGVLAQTDPARLSSAIETYEQLIVLEPGWPSNHANLASLYWLAGREAAAMAQLERAIQLSPQTLIYRLNAYLWEDQLVTYQDLASEVDWAVPAVDADRLASLGWLSLADGKVEDARAFFMEQQLDQPRDGDAYLGLAIVAFLGGRSEDAQQLYLQAELLGTRDAFWRGLLVDGHALDEILSLYQDSSTFGLTVAGAEVYGRGILNRQVVAYDLLPSVNCFTTTPLIEQNVQILQSFYVSQQDDQALSQLDEFELGRVNKVRPCVTIAP